MTPPRAALVAATDAMLAGAARARRSGEPNVEAMLPTVGAHAAVIAEEFAGNEEVAGRVLLAAAAIVASITWLPAGATQSAAHLLMLTGEQVCREGGAA